MNQSESESRIDEIFKGVATGKISVLDGAVQIKKWKTESFEKYKNGVPFSNELSESHKNNTKHPDYKQISKGASMVATFVKSDEWKRILEI